MPPLPSDLRSQLERTVIAARDMAETATRASLIALAVERDAPFPSMSEDQRRLRRGLRAKARQLGGGNQRAGIPLLIDEIAYQQWHRMLFARFLAENGLLMHPAGVAVTLAECAELAPEEGAADAWDLAARYAGAMLPGLFPVDEPAVQVRFAPSTARPWSACWTACRPRSSPPTTAWAGSTSSGRASARRRSTQRAQDRRRRPGPGDPALHRGLHGAVPAAQLPRRLVGRPPSRQPAAAAVRVPAVAR